MVEIRRDSLTGNFLDKTILDTVVMGLGSEEAQKQACNRLLIAQDEEVNEDSILMSSPKQTTGSPLSSTTPSPKSSASTTENLPPATSGTTTSNPQPIMEENKTYEPLTRRRSSIKFDFDTVDYDNPVMPRKKEEVEPLAIPDEEELDNLSFDDQSNSRAQYMSEYASDEKDLSHLDEDHHLRSLVDGTSLYSSLTLSEEERGSKAKETTSFSSASPLSSLRVKTDSGSTRPKAQPLSK